MNRREFLQRLGMATAGAAIAPSSLIPGFVPGSICTPDNPWLKHRIVDVGYSKLDIEITLKRLYSWDQPDFPIAVVPDRQILVERQQAWMNSVITGNFQRRVQLRLIQGFAKDGKDQILFPKEKMQFASTCQRPLLISTTGGTSADPRVPLPAHRGLVHE